MADGPVAFPGLRGAHERREKQVQRQTRAEVVQAAPVADGPHLAFEVALLANGLAECPVEAARVDNGVVGAFRQRLLAAARRDVQLAGTVAALAADGVAVES